MIHTIEIVTTDQARKECKFKIDIIFNHHQRNIVGLFFHILQITKQNHGDSCRHFSRYHHLKANRCALLTSFHA